MHVKYTLTYIYPATGPEPEGIGDFVDILSDYFWNIVNESGIW